MPSVIPSPLLSCDPAQLCIGQRSALLSVLLFVAAVLLSRMIQEVELTGIMKSLGALVLLVTFLAIPGLFFVGALRLMGGLGYGVAKRALILLSLFFSPIGLFILFFINWKVTKALREAGYKIGFLGATAPEAPSPRGLL